MTNLLFIIIDGPLPSKIESYLTLTFDSSTRTLDIIFVLPCHTSVLSVMDSFEGPIKSRSCLSHCNQ